MAGLGRQALDATRGQVYPDAAAGRADATEAADDLVLSTLERGKCFGTVQGSYHVLFERLTGGRRGPKPHGRTEAGAAKRGIVRELLYSVTNCQNC